MPRDVPLHDGPLFDDDPINVAPLERVAPERPELVWMRGAELREAALKREIIRLMRERNARFASAQQHSSIVAEGLEAAPSPAFRQFETVTEDARLAAKDALVRALYASRSWRITSPLRALSRLLGRPPEPTVETALARTDAAAAAASVAPRSQDRCTISPVQRRPEGHSRGEVLVAAPHLPLFDRQAGGLRLKALVGIIAKMGWTVTFCASCPVDWGPDFLASPQGRSAYEDALRAVGVSRFIYGIDGIRAFLIEAGGQMRYAFLSFPSVASDLTPLIRAHCPWARVIFDTVDLHFLRMQREAALRRDPRIACEAERMRELELSCMRSADVTIAVSEAERRLLLDLAPEAVVETIPCIFPAPSGLPPGPGRRSGLLFVGGFWHAPNGDAVVWFAEHVWPRIRAQAPGVVFRIAGPDPTPEVLALARLPNIEVLGHVPDLSPLFDAARVFVAPVRYGAGMKGKVGQSLVNGLPVVATAIGAEGMSLIDGEHLLVADTAEDFAERVLNLLEDDGLWRGLQARGRALIEATLSEAVVERRLEALLRV